MQTNVRLSITIGNLFTLCYLFCRVPLSTTVSLATAAAGGQSQPAGGQSWRSKRPPPTLQGGLCLRGVWRFSWAQDVPTSIEQGLGGCLRDKSAIINLDFLRNPNTYVPQRAQDLHVGSLTLVDFAFWGDLRLGLPCLKSRSPETATARCSNSDTSQTLESLPGFRPE